MQNYRIILLLLLIPMSISFVNAKDVLIVGVSKFPNTMDPIHNWHYLDDEIVEPTIETLVRINQKGNIVGGLAKRWNISNEGKRYKFTLRKSLFSDGSTVQAKDVVFSLRRQIEGSSIGIEGKVLAELISGVGSIYSKDNVVIVDLKTPYLPLIKLLSRPMYGVIKKQKKVSVPPITSGKFKASYNKDGSILTLVRRKKSKSYINKIIIRKVHRTSSGVELKKKSVDMLLGHTFSKDEFKSMDNVFTRTKLESLGSLHLYTNIAGPMGDDATRKKTCQLLKEVAEESSFDSLYLKRAHQYLPKGIMPHTYYKEEIGASKGMPTSKKDRIRIILRKEYISDDYVKKIKKAMGQLFKKVIVERMYIADIIPLLKKKSYDLVLVGFYGFLADPDGHLTPFQNKTGIQIGMFPKQKDQIIKKIQKVRSIVNKRKRLSQYEKIMTDFEKECFVIPQYYVDFPAVINKNLEIDKIKFQYTTLFENIRWKK